MEDVEDVVDVEFGQAVGEDGADEVGTRSGEVCVSPYESISLPWVCVVADTPSLSGGQNTYWQ